MGSGECNQPGIGLSGIAWIEQALEWAHQADPHALLSYNDYGAEDSNARSDYIYAMVKRMPADGVPIHGVGLQVHPTNDVNYPSAAGLAASMKRLTDLGLLAIVTEMDVRLPADASGNASASDLAKQAQLYGRVASACIQFPGCVAIQTWGISDEHSWVPGTFPGTGAALAFDLNYQPKAAYNSLLSPLVTTPDVISAAALTNAASYAEGRGAGRDRHALWGEFRTARAGGAATGPRVKDRDRGGRRAIVVRWRGCSGDLRRHRTGELPRAVRRGGIRIRSRYRWRKPRRRCSRSTRAARVRARSRTRHTG